MPDNKVLAMRIWIFAIVLGFGYWLGSLACSGVALHELAALPKPLVVGWKGASVLALALSALAGRNSGAALGIALALAVSAVADMLLVSVGIIAGGAMFIIAHAIATAAYLSIRDQTAGTVRKLAALAVPVCAVATSFLALQSSEKPLVLALYPIASGVMAGSAILSRFPLLLSGLGATIFVASDVLFLADIGILHGSGRLGFLTWTTYFAGYALVALGAVSSPKVITRCRTAP